jgi:hypothetical protein
MIRFRLAPFVFNWEGLRGKFEIWNMRYQMKLHHIRHAYQAKPKGTKTKTTGNADAWPTFGSLFMNTLVHVLAFYRQSVLLPDVLNVDQGTLPFTEQQVLKRGKREQFVFGIHQVFNLLSASFFRR